MRSGGAETCGLVRLRQSWSQRPGLGAASMTTDHRDPDADTGQSSHPPSALGRGMCVGEEARRHFSTPPRTRPRDRGCHALRCEPTTPSWAPRTPFLSAKGQKSVPRCLWNWGVVLALDPQRVAK